MPFLRSLENKRREISLTGNMLKIVAAISMLIDHIGVMLIQNGKLYGYDNALYQNAISLPEARDWLIIYRLCRIVGRIAFPVFAFLIVEGFRRTSNRFKYAIRLLILALISEIPFNLMVFNRYICFDTQNVVFTYFIGLLMLAAISRMNDMPMPVSAVIAVVAGVICYFLKTDYAIEGIILMYIFYIFRHDINVKCALAVIICFIYSFKNNFGMGILAVPFIYFYNDRRGELDLKQFFYVFFPIHMLVLYAIVFISYIH